MELFSIKLPKKKLSASWEKHVLEFKNPSGTSRGILYSKDCYLLKIQFKDDNKIIGTGECSPIWGLSIDDKNTFENTLTDLCLNVNNYENWLSNKLIHFPAILFGLEMALKSLEKK